MSLFVSITADAIFFLYSWVPVTSYANPSVYSNYSDINKVIKMQIVVLSLPRSVNSETLYTGLI